MAPSDNANLDENFNNNDIRQGDLVDFGVYGKLYVSDPFSYKNLFWVTPEKRDRFEQNSAGWSISKDLALKIIEHI